MNTNGISKDCKKAALQLCFSFPFNLHLGTSSSQAYVCISQLMLLRQYQWALTAPFQSKKAKRGVNANTLMIWNIKKQTNTKKKQQQQKTKTYIIPKSCEIVIYKADRRSATASSRISTKRNDRLGEKEIQETNFQQGLEDSTDRNRMSKPS